MEGKKTITLTRSEFRLKASEAVAEVIAEASEGDIETYIEMSLIASIHIAEIEKRLFKEEDKDGSRN